MHDKVRILFNFYGYYRGAMAGSVYDKNGVCATITTMSGGNRMPMVFEVKETD